MQNGTDERQYVSGGLSVGQKPCQRVQMQTHAKSLKRERTVRFSLQLICHCCTCLEGLRKGLEEVGGTIPAKNVVKQIAVEEEAIFTQVKGWRVRKSAH